MERKENMQRSAIVTESAATKTFIFSAPNVLSHPKVNSADVSLEEASDTSNIKKNVFTFATPTAVSQSSIQDIPIYKSRISEKQYKPKISRHPFKPAVNVFAQALKDTTMFEQLKKNSKSQVIRGSPENSITCTNVPQSLLTKTTAKEYFMMFGNLFKITIRLKKQIIIVTYATKGEATIAYNKSGEYLGEKFNVEWTKSCALPKSPTKKKDFQKNIVTNFLKSPEDEIKSELDAMMNLEYNMHNVCRKNFDGTVVEKKKALQSKSTSKSITRVEKASVKSEKHKADSQISDLLPNATIEELQNIIRQPAHTSEDKYNILEARDRLMRTKQIKSHTLAAAKVMIGTCSDMCPEKERLIRESNRQLSLYEQLDGSEYKINHALAVKQYSRSSADQEEPMAHELRPVKSLKMTMSYLLHEIANLCDEEGTNLGDWYHFLWDRTRGIRKDITQQELCCTDSVELVEQCARFHIVCSERLCAEEPSVFDKKINSDNLTKCLQTLKYMYHDLRVKGINCKNEPEFRAYIILLNLNNSNFMWDLQRLPKSVQRSSAVQFALKVYSVLESNNYYKFFKLVQKTTYLNACILLRYFNQVRLKALSVMVKAYCRTTSTAYPLYELLDILGFEDEGEAIYFCEQIGLNVSKDELHVLLNRQNFSMPVLNINSFATSVANINPDANITTHRKSRTNNFFAFKPPTQINESQEHVNTLSELKVEKQKDAKILSLAPKQEDTALNANRTSESSFGSIFSTTSTTSKSSNVFSKAWEPPSYNNSTSPFVSFTNKSIFSEVSQGNVFTRNVPPSTVFSSTQSNVQTVPELSSVTSTATTFNKNKLKEAQSFPTPTKQAQEETKGGNIRYKEKECSRKMQQINESTEQIFHDLETEIVETYCSNFMTEEINKMKICNTLSEDIKNEILTEVVHQICSSILQEEIIDTQKLHALSIRIKGRIIVKYFNIWKSNVLKKKQRREALDSTPVWLQKYSSEQCAKLLYSKKQDLVIQNMCKRPGEQKATRSYIDSIAPIEVIISMGIKENLKSPKMSMHSNYYWKLVISWPDLHNKPVLWHHKKIMNQYLCPDNYTTEPIIKMCQINQFETLHICLRHFEGLISDHNLVGSDSLLFIKSTSEDTKSVMKRLTKTILSRDRLMPIPLAFIVLGDNNFDTQDVEIVSTLEKLLKARYLSVYTIIHEKDLNEKTVLNMTQSAMLWLSMNKPHQNPLEMDYLQNICDTCLTEELWLRLQDDSSFNEKLLHALNEPRFIIDLHNEAVTYLMDIILDPESFMYTQLAPEFKRFVKNEYTMPCSYEHFDDTWKTEEYKANIENVILSIKLPQWSFTWPLDNSSTLHKNIITYCQEALLDIDSNEVSWKIHIQENEKENERIDTNEPITKKRKLYKDHDNDSELDPLVEFCETSQNQIMEVHCISKKIENYLKAHQQKSSLFEERLKNALFNEM
ncbi:Protein xmas-2 [Dufourea novaeangliae]|uniref:Protein xmas-2 n=1 Tax=Dufourea novaeangliae TaxID=178035 RepID=A0A154PGL6_DUFNO|nr:Protein xmas-2 [Dufourea novaeangliae]